MIHPHNKFERKQLELKKVVPNEQKKKKGTRRHVRETIEEQESERELLKWTKGIADVEGTG